MKIKVQMLGFFKKAGLLPQIYIFLYLLIMFSGSTVIRGQVSNLIVLLVACLAVMTLSDRFGHLAVYNWKDKIPFVLIIIYVIFLFWQMLYIAYEPTIVWTYVKRYAVVSLLLIFLPKIDLAVCAVKFSKYYAFLVACSIIICTAIAGSKSGGLVGDYQAAGMMMSISCILFMIDYFNDKDEKKNLVGILLSVSGLFISGKRMFSLIAIFAFVLIYLLSERENRKVRFWGALILLIIGATILYAAMPSARELFLRITELSGNETNMTSGRNVLWEKAIEIFNEHKLYGIGFGGFQTYYENHYNIPGIQAFLTHNIYYGLLSETGIIGFGIYMSLIVYMLYKSFRLRKKVRSINKYNVTYIYTYSILMQLWFILYGFTGNGIYDANETFFYFSAVAMMLSINQYCSKYK